MINISATPIANVTAGSPPTTRFDVIETRIDEIFESGGGVAVKVAAAELLSLGEKVLELWLEARDEKPTLEQKEGFRLLALHRQGARGDPSFNACRETCRELVYHYNLIAAEQTSVEAQRQLRLMTMVAKHLCLFVGGKMQVAGLGDFCCAAKPMRADGN